MLHNDINDNDVLPVKKQDSLIDDYIEENSDEIELLELTRPIQIQIYKLEKSVKDNKEVTKPKILELTKPIKSQIDKLEQIACNDTINNDVDLIELTKLLKNQIDELEQIIKNDDISEPEVLELTRPLKLQIDKINQFANENNTSDLLTSKLKNDKLEVSVDKLVNINENANIKVNDTNTKSNKIRGLKQLLINRNAFLIIMILVLLSVSLVAFKAVSYSKIISEYENYEIEIENKMDQDMHIYNSKNLDSDVLKNVAASELTRCINENLDINDLPNSVKNIINEINEFYNETNNHFAFMYKDIYTGFTVGYNEYQTIFAASTIKAPTDIYIYEMASIGEIDLDEELTYTPYQFVEGSGDLQNQPMYTTYKTRDLLEYSTVYSDNIAHNILIDNYGRKNMLNFWSNLGTTAIFTQDNNWGVTNANDAMIYMSELYRFYVTNNEYADALMNNFIRAIPKFIPSQNNYVVANKSGWRGTTVHDASIIFADNPYIVVALSNMGYEDYSSYFNKVSDLAYKLHSAYWKYKMNLCENIKQY